MPLVFILFCFVLICSAYLIFLLVEAEEDVEHWRREAHDAQAANHRATAVNHSLLLDIEALEREIDELEAQI